MLAPLSEGKHSLHFTGTFPQFNFAIKLSSLLFFALLIAIAVVVFGRLSKRLVFDFRATVLSVILAILALIYLYWKSRPA
jgi:hypothetical protein